MGHSYDPECEVLARHFLTEGGRIEANDAAVKILAQLFQNTAEAFGSVCDVCGLPVDPTVDACCHCHELTQRAIEAWNAKGDASVEDRMEAVLSFAFERAAKCADASAIASEEQARNHPDHSLKFARDCAVAQKIAIAIRALSATPSPATDERDAVLEDAAKLCLDKRYGSGVASGEFEANYNFACGECAVAIRALQSRPAERK